MNHRAVRWLYGELPGLVEAGVVPPETALRIRHHYGPVPEVQGQRVLLGILAALGAICIGLGIILIFAHNWNNLSHTVRAVLSMAPLLAAQGLAGWTLMRARDSQAWCEASAALLVLAVGASLALIGQTYHIDGTLGSFMLTWLLLGLPVILLFRSTAAAVLGLSGIFLWAGNISMGSRFDASTPMAYNFFWPMLAVIAFHAFQVYQKDERIRLRILLWVGTPILLIVSVLAFGAALAQLYMPGIAILFGALWTLGRLGGERFRWTPLPHGAAVILMGVAMVLSFTESWRIFTPGDTHSLSVFPIAYLNIHTLFLAGLFILSALALWRSRNRLNSMDLPIIVLPAMILLLQILTIATKDATPATMIMNGYLLLVGLLWVNDGVRKLSWAHLNLGLGVLGVFLGCRFLDTDISFLIRGMSFILLGGIFLGANIWVIKKQSSVKENLS